MDGLFLIIGLGLLSLPIAAIAALMRTATLRRELEELRSESRSTVLELTAHIATLRRSMAELTSAQTARVDTAVKEKEEAVPAQVEMTETAQREEVVPEPVQPIVPVTVAPIAAPASVVVPPYVPPMPAEPVIALAATQAPEQAPAPPPRASIPDQEAVEPSVPRRYPPPPSIPPQPQVPRQSLREWLGQKLPLEEVLGMNLFAKIGIVLLVLGFALLGRVAMVSMGPAGKVALLYAASAALLGGGIWLERRDRYRLIGRTGIGGGWALLFFTSYAMNHVQAMHVMASETWNCVLLLAVASAIVIHTLRYKSQLVTGLAFLLGFSTVALTQDTVYALSTGVILALGIIVVSLRMCWYELEVFGILASFGNHFYWLYKLYPTGVAGKAFPQLLPSSIILVLYWLVFRVSYVVRRVETPRHERISTIAALSNTLLLLAVMKFQSTHPELACYALFVLGALEFVAGQLPATRKRRAAFTLLSILGAMLMFAAVPFKFSGNSIALLWMIGSEALLVAGITQRERVFRRLGLVGGALTGVFVGFESRGFIEQQLSAEHRFVSMGTQLLLCASIFYINAHFVRRRWRTVFDEVEGQFAAWQSYLGAAMAFLGVWAMLPGDGTAVGWAVLFVGAIAGMRYLGAEQLTVQAWLFALAFVIRAAFVNCHPYDPYPHHMQARLVTLPLLAVLSYLAAWLVPADTDVRTALRSVCMMIGTALLVALAVLEMNGVWVALAWLGIAIVLCLTSRFIDLADLCWQEHVLVLFVIARLVVTNLPATNWHYRVLPFAVSAAALYAMSRHCTRTNDVQYKLTAAWAHTWAATGLLAALAWHDAPQPWLAVIWVVFALMLAAVDRVFRVDELPLQAHVLAFLAMGRAATLNLYVTGTWHGVEVRLVTLSIVAASLYVLKYLARVTEEVDDAAMNHVYSWAASAAVGWLLWCELQPVAVADGLAACGLVLFEWGALRKERALRLQGYAMLLASFVRLFLVNLTAKTEIGDFVSPRVYTVVPVVMICLYLWYRLREKSEQGIEWSIGNLLAWCATFATAALCYFQVAPEWVIVSWAILAVALLAADLVLKKEVFLQQALAAVAAVVTRGLAHNIFGGSYFTGDGWRGNFAVVSIAAVILMGALPIAFALRDRYKLTRPEMWLSRVAGFAYPEQWLFFSPVLLVTLMIAVKMNPGMVTLSWGLEAVSVIILGLAVSQRSYRIAGLLLLVLCVCKIVFRDAWHLTERDRYITFIALGTALMLVSTLYNRYRDSVRRLL